MKYPDVKRVDTSDDYYGTTVIDPYRYMEDPDDPEVLRFVQENNAIVDTYFTSEEIKYFSDKLAKMLDYNKFYVPVATEQAVFYARQEPEQLQPVIYGLYDDQERVVLDINALSEDGTVGSMVQFYSDDGRYLVAYITPQGSDWQRIFVKNIESNTDLEELVWVNMGTIAWNKDNSGFYYAKYPDQTGLGPEDQRRGQKLFYHIIGTTQDQDVEIFAPEDREENVTPTSYDHGTYLVIALSSSTLPENKLGFRKNDGDWQWLMDHYDGSFYRPVNIIGNQLYLLTSWQAGNNRLMRVDLAGDLAPSTWEEIIPETDHVIRGCIIANGQLVVTYEGNVKHLIKVFTIDGSFDHEIQLPSIGQLISGSYNPNLTGRKDSPQLYLGFTSFAQPMTLYNYNLETKQLQEFQNPSLDIDISNIEVNQVFYDSKDGTKIPMYLIHKTGLEKNSKNPTYLYGYGGFNISILPAFNSQIFAWVEDGGIYAIANLRGGGEYGKKWHQQALLGNKQNVFDDFIAAAEYLISENYTSSAHIGINGRSNGGLLVGATITQRPDLFGAAIPQVGVLDMLRFPVQKDAGRYWVGEYGDAKNNKEHFEFLIEYSPYHNVKAGTEYPPILVTAAEGDDRVAPAHSKKFGAALQYAQSANAPILVRIESKAGHGYGKPISKIIEDTAINLAFFKRHLS